MDGVLLDSERIIKDEFTAACHSLGYQISDDIYLASIGRDQPTTREIFKSMVDPLFPYELIAAQVRRNIQYKLEGSGWPLKPRVLDALNFATMRQIRRVVATSTAKSVALARLSSAKIDHHFECITGGDEVTQGKPAPDIFLLAAKRLEVSPHHCLVIEDSEHGARAALAAGMTCVMVPDLKQPPEDIRTKVLGVFYDISTAIEFAFSSTKEVRG